MDTNICILQMSDAERYGDEVLNASWLPPEPSLGPQDGARPARQTRSTVLTDIDDFMSRLYSAQE